MTPPILSSTEIRVLGALIEKELSTPDHYPLSLNALTAACNQSSNREPVMDLDEGTVMSAVDTLRRASLVRSFQSSGSRVPKYSHLLADAWELSRAELAVLCVLSLRGPQTLAEVKTRAARLLPDGEVESVEPALENLIVRAPAPLAARLPRRPGQKEQRYATLLGGEVSYEVDDAPAAARAAPADRIAALEESVQELRRELDDVRAEFAEFRKQFE
jgi:uncharacterized protein